MRSFPLLLATSLLVLTGCGDSGLSTADVQQAAQERVRQTLKLDPQAALFTNVFVGEEVDGDQVLCGTVEGRTAGGETITPRRFIAATEEPARWIKFEPATGPDLPTQPDMFVEWQSACRGEEAVK